jgi:outer membrane immunogenic protein
VYSSGNVVLGFEWDFDGVANNNNTGNGLFIPAVGTIQVTPNNNWITTLAARFGVMNGYWLSYGKVGGGWVGNDNFTVTNVTPGASITGSNRNTNSGWLVGHRIGFREQLVGEARVRLSGTGQPDIYCSGWISIPRQRHFYR